MSLPVCLIWKPNYSNDSSYHRGTQALLSLTEASLCSQHFIRLHITTEYRPAQIPEMLRSCQQANFYVCLSLCARVAGLQRTEINLSLHSHQCGEALLLLFSFINISRNFFPTFCNQSQPVFTVPSLCK